MNMPEPKFVPRPGQVDYTNIRYAPTVNIVVVHDGKIFCVKRSADMRLYPGQWDWVAGFLDDTQSIEDKSYEELREELGLQKDDVLRLTRGQPWIDEAEQYHKTWLIIPVLAEVKKNSFALNWEASRGAWFTPRELRKLDLIPEALRTAAQFFPELADTPTTTHEKESYDALLARLAQASKQIEVGGRYVHYKDKRHTYRVVRVALREEDNEPCVVYEAEYMPGTTWVRPLASWLEEIDVDGKKVKRFTKIS